MEMQIPIVLADDYCYSYHLLVTNESLSHTFRQSKRNTNKNTVI